MRAMSTQIPERRSALLLMLLLPSTLPPPHLSGHAGKVAEQVAVRVGVSTRTCERAIYVLKHAGDKLKQRLRRGESTIYVA